LCEAFKLVILATLTYTFYSATQRVKKLGEATVMLRKAIFQLAVIFTSLSVVVQFSGCGSKDAEKNAASNAEFDALWTNVFADSCGTCHGVATNSNTAGGPDLRTKATFHSNLVSKKPSDYAEWAIFKSTKVACASTSFVAPAASAKSLLVAIFDATVSAALSPCQVKSHLTPDQNITISDANLTSLKSWIDAGAGL
jgi:cytochrome c553